MSVLCKKCGQKISGKAVRIGTEHFHPECMTCWKCGQRIVGTKFKKSASGKFCCETCSAQALCAACKKPVSGKILRTKDEVYHLDCFKCTACGGALEQRVVVNGKNMCPTCAAGASNGKQTSVNEFLEEPGKSTPPAPRKESQDEAQVTKPIARVDSDAPKPEVAEAALHLAELGQRLQSLPASLAAATSPLGQPGNFKVTSDNASDAKPAADSTSEEKSTYFEKNIGEEESPPDNPEMQQAVASLFKLIDTNGDGCISREEWLAAFEMIDDDKNGCISRKEWMLHQGETYVYDAICNKRFAANITKQQWEKAFDALDINNDGGITAEEWSTPQCDIKYGLSLVPEDPENHVKHDKHTQHSGAHITKPRSQTHVQTTPGQVDELLLGFEVALAKCIAAGESMVKRTGAETRVLECVGHARDAMLHVLKDDTDIGANRVNFYLVFGGDCVRTAKIRHMLEMVELTGKRQEDPRKDQALGTCSQVEGLLRDHGDEDKLQAARASLESWTPDLQAQKKAKA